MKIIFLNTCNIGDTYFSQPFVKNIITNNSNNEYYIYNRFNTFNFTEYFNIKDVNKIPEFKEEINKIFNFVVNYDEVINYNNINHHKYLYNKENNILIINTWLGIIRESYPTKFDCNLLSYHETYKKFINDINTSINSNIFYENNISLDVYPIIPTLYTNKFEKFKSINKNKKIIFYYNYLASSCQPFPIKNLEEHNYIIESLAKDNIVIVTNNSCNNINNVYFADDFLEIDENNKNEIYYNCKNLYYYAQMANDSNISIYYDNGRSFMYANKTFIEENNKNIKLHLSLNNYYYNNLNNNILVPCDYMKLIIVTDYKDIIEKLKNVI